MPTMHIKIDRPKQAAAPHPHPTQIPEDEIVEYEAMIAADLGIISGPLLNNQANTK